MTAGVLGTAVAVAGLAGAAALAAPTPADAVTFAQWAARPATLPFAWRGVRAAERHGDPVEAFVRARSLMRLLPQWSEGFAAFAYRYALAPDLAALAPTARAERARARLLLALAWMDAARADAGRHEASLLQAMAFLPEVAAHAEPGLGEALRAEGGPAALADRWLAVAETRVPSPEAREQRTFYAVRLAAGLLAAGDRDAALAVLQTASERSHAVRDQQLAAGWRAHVELVQRALRGEPGIDLAPVFADPRFADLLPHLR